MKIFFLPITPFPYSIISGELHKSDDIFSYGCNPSLIINKSNHAYLINPSLPVLSVI